MECREIGRCELDASTAFCETNLAGTPAVKGFCETNLDARLAARDLCETNYQASAPTSPRSANVALDLPCSGSAKNSTRGLTSSSQS